MQIFYKKNTYHAGNLELLKSHSLLGKRNINNINLSVQISIIPANSEQPIHRHQLLQCYYIIKKQGLMIIEEEQHQVKAGDAIFIPSDHYHGIQNMGYEPLEYLTANAPAFDEKYEMEL